MNNKFSIKNKQLIIKREVKDLNDDDFKSVNSLIDLEVIYEGSQKEWVQVNKCKIISSYPCIKCNDGIYIQWL